MAQELIRRGIETQVVTFGDKASEDAIDGVPVVFLDGSPRRGWREKLAKNWQVYRDLRRVMAEFQPTVVHQQTALGHLPFYTGLAARRCGIPRLLKYSSDPPEILRRAQRGSAGNTPPQRKSIRWHSRGRLIQKQRFLFSLYDSVWATTPAFQARLTEDFQVSPKKVFLLPNFIDLSKFQQVADGRASLSDGTLTNSIENRRLILTVTRLLPFKGVDVCIRAFTQLQDLPIQLRIIGEGPSDYVAYLRELVRQAGLENRIEFLGPVSPHEIHRQYAQADVFALASTYEPFGIVLVEAMAAGVPIVASRVDGIPAVVEDCALLVAPEDDSELAQALRKVLECPQTSADLVKRERQRAERFGLQKGCDRMVERYEELLK